MREALTGGRERVRRYQRGDVVLVDLRTRAEVNAKGVVELPKGAAKKLALLERTQLEKTREFKNVKGTEAGITAVQVRVEPWPLQSYRRTRASSADEWRRRVVHRADVVRM